MKSQIVVAAVMMGALAAGTAYAGDRVFDPFWVVRMFPGKAVRQADPNFPGFIKDFDGQVEANRGFRSRQAFRRQRLKAIDEEIGQHNRGNEPQAHQRNPGNLQAIETLSQEKQRIQYDEQVDMRQLNTSAARAGRKVSRNGSAPSNFGSSQPAKQALPQRQQSVYGKSKPVQVKPGTVSQRGRR